MKLQVMAALGAVLVLGGCGSGGEDEGTGGPAPEAAAPDAAAPETAAAPAAGEKPTKEFVVGKWGNDGDCELAIDLKADGTSDGPFGNWTYADGVIGFADVPEMKITVTVVDDKTMDSINAQGGKHQMTRC